MSSAAYEPIRTETPAEEGRPSPSARAKGPSSKTASPAKGSPSLEAKKDPLYAAMFGGVGGGAAPSSTGGSSSLNSRFDGGGIDTLDEPVIETLKRDLMNIREKLKNILLMRTPPSESINDWDLWGPLIMCLALAMSLGLVAKQSVFVFTLTFVLVWVGSMVVTANCRLLGYRLSFFQNVCLLGYGLFPLVCASLLNMVFPLLWVLKLALAGFALGWSTVVTVRSLTDESLQDRKLLAAYPLFVFYFIIFWLIIVL